MPSLLGLPLELREYIIEEVLHDCRTLHATPSKSNRVDFQDINYKAWRNRNCGIYHEQRSTHCPSNCLSLLSTNHQISAETQSVLNRLKSARYALDVSVLNDSDLFPTWLSVPWITNRISTLTVDVRLFGHILSRDIARRQVGDGGHLGFHWSFYALLERFLRYGPVDEKKGVSQEHNNIIYADRDMTVETLVLDFQSAEPKLSFPPDEIDYGWWLARHFAQDHRYVDLNSFELSNFTTRPEWLLKYLLSEIRSLLCMSYHTALYGKILYEQIGTIRMLVNGELAHEIDMAAQLATLRFTEPEHTFGHLSSEDRVSAFWAWKKQTLSRRDQLGFPVVWPQDPELI